MFFVSMAERRCEGQCEECKKLGSNYKKALTEKTFFIVHVLVDVLTKKLKESEEKQRKLKEVEKIACGLRNTEGGDLLIHLSGQDTDDKYLGHLDEFLDITLNKLIPDGKLYTEIYTRQWLHEKQSFKDFKNFVLLRVTKSSFISTVDFKTKVSSDFKVEKADTFNVVSLINRASHITEHPPLLRGISNYATALHENREVELKVFLPKNPEKIQTVDDFVDYVWDDLSLKDHITCMSKVETGGSYYVGMKEAKPTLKQNYETKTIEPTGFSALGTQEDYRKSFLTKINKNASLLSFDGTLGKVPERLINFEFYASPFNTKKWILEIAIGCAKGIIFYDKKGPETYTIKAGRVLRMDIPTWFEKIRRINIVDRVTT